MKVCSHCNKEIKRTVHKNTKNPFCDSKCYSEWQKGKSFEEQGKPRESKRICTVKDCDSTHFGKGYCRKHYLREYYNKNNSIPKKTRTRIIICRECDYCSSKYKTMREDSKYCGMKCSGLARRKDRIIKKGYAKILMPNHQRADSKGYVFEHIVVMEEYLGRDVKHPEVIHHLDHNPLNNDVSNLVVCPNQKYHMENYH